jgi:predicted flap endonuclease-1-like 5' DNA nuclease
MAQPDLIVQTPFKTEVFRSGATLAVTASFHRGQPMDPTRLPRDIVVSLLDAAGKEVGDGSSLLDPKHPVRFTDMGMFYAGYPVMIYAWPEAPASASGDFRLRVRYRPKQGAQTVAEIPIRLHKKGETPPLFEPAKAPGGQFNLTIARPPAGASFLPGETIDLAIQSAIDSKVAYFYNELYSQDEHDLVLVKTGKPDYRMVPDPKNPAKQVYQYEFEFRLPFEKSAGRKKYVLACYLVSMKGDGVFQGVDTTIQVGEEGAVPESLRGTRKPRGVAAPAEPPVVIKVDINSDSQSDLELLRGVGAKLAKRIMSDRPFSSVDDLDRVQGVGPHLLERLRPALRV